MLFDLEIKNFKSVKSLSLQCKRINIFVGEPNTGKSNILEAFGLFSYAQFSGYGPDPHSFVRFLRTTNLFYDEAIETPLQINLDKLSLTLKFENNLFHGEAFNKYVQASPIALVEGDYKSFRITSQGPAQQKEPLVKYYKFSPLEIYNRPESVFLLPPDGNNLLSLLLSNRELRALTNGIFSRFGLKLVLKPHENIIEIIKPMDDILIEYPYPLVSDTLQRVVFFLCAILSSKNSVLVFEEPEAHTFPYYTKYLAELIALDKQDNQYFIATHNPYFLEPLIAKTPVNDLNIFVTYYENYETKVRLLNQSEIQDLMQIDIFSNLDKYINTHDRS